MSRKNSSGGKKRTVPKNKIKKRLEVLEGTQADGIDKIIMEIRRLSDNDFVIAGALETQDNNLAAMKFLCIEKGVFTEEDFETAVAEIEEIRAAARKQAQEKAELEEQVAQAEQEAEQADPELARIRKAAEDAAGDEHPEGAFMFGG